MFKRKALTPHIIVPAMSWRLPCYCLLVVSTMVFGCWKMLAIININDMSFLDPLILVLFTLCFGWIATAFWSSIIGFFLLLLKRDPLTLKSLSKDKENLSAVNIKSKTALVMPVYNEDTQRVMAGIEAILTSLDKTTYAAHFDFYLLSDSNNPEVVQQENKLWQVLSQRLHHLSSKLYYRRRTQNKHRKVGNIADFCQRWGHHYEHMIVLDADSLMTGDSLVHLVKKIQTHPSVGLIQTIPTPVRQQTFFGRFLQFSAELHTPILATGNNFWQMTTANYWGHNAIIRIDAFMQHCGLPTLAGKDPFGGEILSHDFVEAALLKRAGWDTLLVTEPIGSFEEVPSNLIDYIIRDRRWAQGNIQHLGLLKTKGLAFTSRLHFFFGAFAYISSPLWLIMLALGTSDAALDTLKQNQFFTETYQLFPHWHIAQPDLVYSLLGNTLILLFTPKILSLIIAQLSHGAEFGGRLNLLLSALLEIIAAIILAPVMMVFHTYFVLSTLMGNRIVWNTQSRTDRGVPWAEAIKRTLLVTLLATIWGSLSYAYVTDFFWWLLPILIGLVMSAPIIRYSGSVTLGRCLQSLNIFSTPNEMSPTLVVRHTEKNLKYYTSPTSLASLAVHSDKHTPHLMTDKHLPQENWRNMPIQRL